MPEFEGRFLPDSTRPHTLALQVAPEIHDQIGVEDVQSISRRQVLQNSAVEGLAAHYDNWACRDCSNGDWAVPLIRHCCQKRCCKAQTHHWKPAYLYYTSTCKAGCRKPDLHRNQVTQWKSKASSDFPREGLPTEIEAETLSYNSK